MICREYHWCFSEFWLDLWIVRYLLKLIIFHWGPVLESVSRLRNWKKNQKSVWWLSRGDPGIPNGLMHRDRCHLAEEIGFEDGNCFLHANMKLSAPQSRPCRSEIRAALVGAIPDTALSVPHLPGPNQCQWSPHGTATSWSEFAQSVCYFQSSGNSNSVGIDSGNTQFYR